MIIDIIFAILIVFAVIKGFQKGLIVALFSFAAFFIGLAAALKLSAVAAGYIGKTVKVSDQWLPVVAFIVVFLIVVILVHLGAKAIEKAFQLAMLGWINRLGGVIFYVLMYIIIFSVLLFYAEQMQMLKPETVGKSVTYDYVQPWGPKAINAFGKLVPLFKDMFEELKEFFGNLPVTKQPD